jgi:hypothetical protein
MNATPYASTTQLWSEMSFLWDNNWPHFASIINRTATFKHLLFQTCAKFNAEDIGQKEKPKPIQSLDEK